ncbi:retrovirus-related pol polyprotein from transposon tnt 1-94, partial [Trifolium medium]|nr:retrovirus-related pol polyprotein from transposon tnt 1-94 [Trifolium medium]
SPTLSVKDVTPEEAWSGSKPTVHHFKIFGCLTFVHVPDAQRKKLDGKSIKCILLGVNEDSKAYRLYDPVNKKVIVSRDVIFEESKGWNWNESKQKQQVDAASTSNDESSSEELDVIHNDVETHNENVNEADSEEDSENSQEQDEINDEQESTDSDELPPKPKRRHGYLDDYVLGDEIDQEAQIHNLAVYSTSEDTVTYDDAVKFDVWRKAMDQEIESIEKKMILGS